MLTTGELSATTVNVLESAGLRPVATAEAADRLRCMVVDEPSALRLLALAEVSYALGLRDGGGAAPVGWKRMTVAALASWAALFHEGASLSPFGPESSIARTLHNASLAEVVVGLVELPGTDEAHIQRPLVDGEIEIDYRWSAAPWRAASFVRFAPADAFRVRGMRNRHRQAGVGAALLGERVADAPASDDPAGKDLPRFAQAVALSAVISGVAFADGAAWPPVSFDLRIHDSSHTRTTLVAGNAIPLEADFTAALTDTLGRDRPLQSAGFGGLRNVDQWQSFAGLYMLEPFDPNRIPVIFIHGLVSSPMVWREMINDLWGDPWVRERYQFWVFLYPTGNPFAYSAALLRRQIEQVRLAHDPKRDSPALRNMVLVGHSMGGLLARLCVTAPGDALWKSVSDVPFEDAAIDNEADRELLREVFLFDPVPGVTRVVFIATPHRGSVIADLTPGRLGSRLIRLPPALIESAGRVFEANPDQVRLSRNGRLSVSTGIDSLSPQSPFLRTLADLPIAPGVAAHSIIGRKSGGDAPGGSDGVVRYESAHVADVESELVIPNADHGVPQQPAATREVRRILGEHAGGGNARPPAPAG